ncbi:unnamed protein product, partial [Symbiodinium microadriaticum]
AVVDDQREAAVYETQACFAVQLGQNYMLISGQICKQLREKEVHMRERFVGVEQIGSTAETITI